MSKNVTKVRVEWIESTWRDVQGASESLPPGSMALTLARKTRRGWAYMTDDQAQWDTVCVKPDDPDGEERLVTPSGLVGFLPTPLIRLKSRNLRILSDLEALAEVGAPSAEE